MQMSSERDSILLEYEEMKGSFEELSQRYEELRTRSTGATPADPLTSSFNNNVSFYTEFLTMQGFILGLFDSFFIHIYIHAISIIC